MVQQKTGIGIVLAFFNGGGRVIRKWEMAVLVAFDVIGHALMYGSFISGISAGLILYGVLGLFGGVADIKTYLDSFNKTDS